jgi:hypothetical protein
VVPKGQGVGATYEAIRKTMGDETALEISCKLNVLIALALRQLVGDKDFSKGRRKGTGEIAQYLAGMGLDAKDIARILGSPVTSIRTLLTPKRRGR